MQRPLSPDGNKIRTLRVQRNWPQEQLARIADLSPRTIQRVEAGGNASYETLRSIACAFEIEARELLKEQPETARLTSQEATKQEPVIAEPGVAAPIIVTNNDRRLSRSLWAALLATAIAFLGYLPQFLVRVPISEGTTVDKGETSPFSNDLSDRVPDPARPMASNSSQAPSGVSLAAERLPDSEPLVQIRSKTRVIEKGRLRQHRTIQTAESSPVPIQALDTSLPNLATPRVVSTLARIESWHSAPKLTGQSGQELAVTHQVVSSPECDEMLRQTDGGLTARSKNGAGSGYRSATDAARRFSKRTTGFFSRLKASF